VADEIEALRRVGGDAAVALIRREPNPAIQAIVETWPESFDTRRARDLGFGGDASFDALVELHLAETQA